VELQGRFDNDKGLEFAEWLIPKYRKPGVQGWTKYTNESEIEVKPDRPTRLVFT
jgi:hypothetical protein